MGKGSRQRPRQVSRAEFDRSWGRTFARVGCGRCGRSVLRSDAEQCWYCSGRLCADCWEERGHCGHPAAEAVDEMGRARG